MMGFLLCAVLAAAPPPGPEVQRFRSPETAAANLPFSDAVRVGDLVFVSGKIGTGRGERALVPGGIGPETQRALENVRTALEEAGTSVERVAKCTVFLADMKEWPAMNEVYARFFGEHRPARSALGTSGLALGARVEIECIAAAGGGPARP